jgi:fatty-acyl-CoA synthase
MFIGDWLGRRAKLTPDKIALIDTVGASERKITYAEWHRQAMRTQHFLAEELDVQKGDRVAVLAANSVDYLDVWFALGKQGAILQNLNWRLAVPELERVLLDAEPVALIYSSEFSAQVDALRDRVPSARHWVAFDQASRPQDLLFSRRDAHPDTPLPDLELAWDDPWVLCYTGGTTGLPKGAVLTHGSMAANSINTVMSWGVTPDDVVPLISPLFHTGGLNVFTLPLVHIGGTTVLTRGWNTDQMYDLIERRVITLFFAVPTMFVMLQAHPKWETTDFTHLKYVINGGAPCPLPVFEKWWAKGVPFKTGYGLTEAGPNTFWLPEHDVQRKPGSVGHPLFHVDVQIVDPESEEPCNPEQVGELLIRGPHVCRGYWRNPDATREVITEDRWLRTGDLGELRDGLLFLSSRRTDLILRGAENVYPAEIESCLEGHPGVAEVAVVGLPDEEFGQIVAAAVVPAPGVHLDEAELAAFVKERLAYFKVPSRWFIRTTTLPRTATGKVVRGEVLKQLGDVR